MEPTGWGTESEKQVSGPSRQSWRGRFKKRGPDSQAPMHVYFPYPQQETGLCQDRKLYSGVSQTITSGERLCSDSLFQDRSQCSEKGREFVVLVKDGSSFGNRSTSRVWN